MTPPTPTPKVPTPKEVRTEKDPHRKALLAAMARIADGQPLHVEPGAYSAVALTEEAQVPRYYLVQKHTDLRDRWKYIQTHYLEPLEPEDEDERIAELSRQIADLQKRNAKLVEERDNWKATTKLLTRAMNVQEVALGQKARDITRLEKRLARAEAGATDELTARRHRRK